MRILGILMFAVQIAQGSSALASNDNLKLVGKTVICSSSNGYRVNLKFDSTGDYHRDGYWYRTELDGPVLHVYTFVASLADRYSGKVSGWSFEAFINRALVSYVSLEDTRGTLDPVSFPVGFRGVAALRNGTRLSLMCSYL